MRVVVTRNTFVRGQLYEASAEPVEIADGDAKALIAMGKAHLASGEPEPTEPAQAAEKPLPAREPDLTSLPYPLRRKVSGKGKKS
jgi:hypothetical protein